MKNQKNKPKVMVNLLNQGQVSNGLELQLYLWMKEYSNRYEFVFFEPTDRPISNNRNTIAKKFLDEGYDILVMFDSDMCPLKNPFELLTFDKDVIGMVYPGWGDNGIRLHVYKFGDEFPHKIEFKQYLPEERNGLAKVDAIGTGAIFVKRKVLEEIKKPFEDMFDADGILITNDDLAFSYKCYLADVEIWTHWDFVSRHFKTVDLLKVTELIYDAAATGIPVISKNVLKFNSNVEIRSNQIKTSPSADEGHGTNR